jgi:hypothetical protein
MAPSKPDNSPIGVAAAALLVVVGLLALASPSRAEARSCGRIHVGVSKHVVRSGKPLRVRGVTCTAKAKRPRFVRIKLRTRHGWRQIGVARTRATGRFSRRVRAKVSGRRRRTVLKVVARGARSPSVPLEVSDPAASSAPAASSRGCPLDNPASMVGMTASGCRLVASDTAANRDPMPFWGSVQCGVWPHEARDQATRPATGGDVDPTATGAPQGNDAYRRLTVFDGDNFAGERCELGLNDMDSGPTNLFYEGMRRATFFSVRLPENFELGSEDWQTVLQMKQAQPSQDGNVGPMIELEATRGQWLLVNHWDVRWGVPAQKGVWTRFVFDVVYSRDPSKGSIQVGVDLNGDGDFNDPGERSPKLSGATLATQTAPGYEVPPGGSIPSHLRSGIYHNEKFSCPRPTGCSVELDNVQVMGS